jgi:GNAT superfamily N-acetyltransferase
MSPLVIDTLTVADIASNVRLSQSVGWPDTEGEWRVAHEAALVLGVRRDAELVGQGALGSFEGAGSLAKMVVAPHAQRQGVGAAILDHALGEATSRGLFVVSLVATALGRPLYESRAFQPLGGVCILVGTPRFDHALAELPAAPDAERLCALERRFTGSARTAMLRARFRESTASAADAGGFVLATAQQSGARVGPLFAESEEVARSLAMSVFRAAAGPVRVDVPAEQSAFRAWLLGLGLLEKGVNVEMSRGGQPPWRVAQRFALATQAWG